MYMKASNLLSNYVRRREIDQERTERLTAVDRYYDHWGKVNSRYENWTAPEYYKKADEKLEKRKTAEQALKQLKVRRGKMRELFDKEKKIYEQEMREYERPRSRKLRASTQTLAKIDENLKQRENIKRKLDAEAKLYGRWRHGVDDDNLLFESKTDNETLAKLNWLDKQVDDQLKREQEKQTAEERQLRMQEELLQTELVQRERQKIREQEIKEISALQQRHLDEIKQRQGESEALKEAESRERHRIDEMDKELELLKESLVMARSTEDLSQASNLSKIKVYLRKRSEMFRGQIKMAIGVLERMRSYASNPDIIETLIDKYKEQLDAEQLAVGQVDAMYESEAKYNLQRCEAAWQTQVLERYDELRQLVLGEQCLVSAKLNDNLQRQSDIIDIRSTHLSSIENSNEKLKQLIREEEESPRTAHVEATPSEQAADDDGVSQQLTSRGRRSAPHVSDSFRNLNMASDPMRIGGAAKQSEQSLPSRQCSPRPSTSGLEVAQSQMSLPSRGSPRSLHPRGGSSFSNLNMESTSPHSVVSLQPSSLRRGSNASLPQVTNSFTNLNLDVWKNVPAGRGALQTSPSATKSLRSVVTPENFERPKFARKRVAWM